MKPQNQSEYVEPYYQVPKIVAEFDKMTNDHIIIFMHLYEQLRQRKEWNKSNSELAILARVSESTVKRRLNELESWDFIDRKGMGFNRKFTLGLKFNNRVTVTLKENNTGSHRPSTGSPVTYIDKNIFKNIINSSAHAIKIKTPSKNKFDELTGEDKLLVQNYAYDLKNPSLNPSVPKDKFNRAKVLYERTSKHNK